MDTVAVQAAAEEASPKIHYLHYSMALAVRRRKTEPRLTVVDKRVREVKGPTA